MQFVRKHDDWVWVKPSKAFMFYPRAKEDRNCGFGRKFRSLMWRKKNKTCKAKRTAVGIGFYLKSDSKGVRPH